MAPPRGKLMKEREIQLSVWVPHQLSTRLDDLCRLVNHERSAPIRRKHLVAALLFDAPETAKAINDLIERYENAPPDQATVGAEKGARVYEFQPAKPGPRPAS